MVERFQLTLDISYPVLQLEFHYRIQGKDGKAESEQQPRLAADFRSQPAQS